MDFLLDHCIWGETENILTQAGFTCITLKKLGKTEVTDKKVIKIAQEQNAILVTRDRDFSNISLYPLKSHSGIILLRITPDSAERVHNVLLESLRIIPKENITGHLLIITSTTYRLHR